MPYIYKIVNQINNKIYVGKTSHTSLKQRFQEHIQDSKKEYTEKRPLYDAFKKYGIENFQIELIEKVKDDIEASKKEAYWIKTLNSYVGFPNSNGYNATLGGDGKRIYNYALLAQEYTNLGTVKAVCEKYNCDPATVKKACEENNVKIAFKLNRKKVCRIDCNNNIKYYNSITEAAKDYSDINSESVRKNISRALNHQKTAYGYIWKYI